ncbi:MAG: hypothetical protein HY696_12480 [Deltaproteobacteria bacterium]|nr:hypothetical protein [Deltaproteobacteria bacterium]
MSRFHYLLAVALCSAIVALPATNAIAKKKETGRPLEKEHHCKHDGLTFRCELSQLNGGRAQTIDLFFASGKLNTTAFAQHGFQSASYKSTGTDWSCGFQAQMKGDNKKVLTWTGTVQGDALEAAATLAAPGQAAETYTVECELKK